MDPWLPDCASGGFHLFIRRSLAHASDIECYPLAHAIEVDLFQARLAVFFIYYQPNREQRIEEATTDLSARFLFWRMQGYKILILGDFNSLHPFYLPNDDTREAEAIRQSRYNPIIHPWLRDELLFPLPIQSHPCDDLIPRPVPFSFQRGTHVPSSPAPRSLIDFACYFSPTVSTNVFASCDIVKGLFPGAHFPIHIKVPRLKVTHDPRLRPTSLYLRWSEGTFPRSAQVMRLVSPLVSELTDDVKTCYATSDPNKAYAAYLTWRTMTLAVSFFCRESQVKLRSEYPTKHKGVSGNQLVALSQAANDLKLGKLTPMNRLRLVNELLPNYSPSEGRSLLQQTIEQIHLLIDEHQRISLQRHHQWADKQTQKIETLANKKEQSKFWRQFTKSLPFSFIFPSDTGVIHPSIPDQGSQVIAKWMEVFNEQFVQHAEDAATLERLRRDLRSRDHDGPFTLAELHTTFRKKSRCAPGFDGIGPGFIISAYRQSPHGLLDL